MDVIRYDIAKKAKAKGWTNANRLAKGAGLSYPVAYRLLHPEPLERIDIATLETVARALGVSNPLSLLKHTEPSELLARD